MLLEAAEEIARSHGAQELRLDVAKDNDRAIAAYVSHGYEAFDDPEEPDSLERMFSKAL
jgi:ribosomal protein S18 acetylase RimI-like enzyme